MNWFVYFTITTIFAVPVKVVATEEECDKDKAAQFVEFAKGMHQQDQLIEPTFTIHDPEEDLKDVQDRLEQILNRGIENSVVYYKVVERKTAITCITGKHSTAVVILQLKETECEKATDNGRDIIKSYHLAYHRTANVVRPKAVAPPTIQERMPRDLPAHEKSNLM
ncbi:hypothetical protein D918_03206 [Trichuris suis]|nr:hypothetical protein D918_03206 [Trichuris suis]